MADSASFLLVGKNYLALILKWLEDIFDFAS
jgi:hypothetical protein